ncbi:MAG: MarR family transcriptional regulator [Dehalococcoidales bacterium]|nr:MarR family transcriptional regulator [Dehalococcoidales bacterium]
MDKNAVTKEEQFNTHLNKLNDFVGELLSDGPLLIETENNLTMSQLRVLLLLKMKQKMKMTQLAAALKIHVSTATGLLDRLIAKKLVKRESGEDDRRVIYCSLTEDGLKITDAIWQVVGENARSLAEYITLDELNIIGHSIDILQRAWTKRKVSLGAAISSESF